jgi:chemotaxis protein histidine kinase CheA
MAEKAAEKEEEKEEEQIDEQIKELESEEDAEEIEIGKAAEKEEEKEEEQIDEQIKELESEEDAEEIEIGKKVQELESEEETEESKLMNKSDHDHGDEQPIKDQVGSFAPSICGKDRAHVHEQCAEKRPICKYKKVSDPREERGFRLLPELEPGQHACIRRCDPRFGLGPEFCLNGDNCVSGISSCTDCDNLTDDGKCQPFKSDSIKTDDSDKKFTPSICGKDRAHVHEQCAEERPICKYKKVTDPSEERGFRLVPELEPGQRACIRRCDTRFGLGPEFCHVGEDCVSGIPSCTDCDNLMDDGKCQPYKND